MNENKTSKLLSLLQVGISSILALLIFFGIFLANRWGGSDSIRLLLLNIFPEMAIILGTLIPALVLRIKHRSQVAEGYLLPLFLLFLSLQTIRMLPSLLLFLGHLSLSATTLEIINRFIVLSSYVILLYAALQNLKNSYTTKTGTYVSLSLVAVFIISCIIPISSGADQFNYHQIVFNFLVALVLISAVLTYLVSFISSRENYHLKRFFTFLFISAGDYLIVCASTSMAMRIAGTIFFVVGAIMLCAVSPNSY